MDTFCLPWGTFCVHLSPLGSFVEPFGGMLCYWKRDFGAKGVPGAPYGANPRNKRTCLERFCVWFLMVSCVSLYNTGVLKNIKFLSYTFNVFLFFLKQVEPVKYSKTIVGAFKNRVCTKNEKMEPGLDLVWILAPLWLPLLVKNESLCEKRGFRK